MLGFQLPQFLRDTGGGQSENMVKLGEPKLQGAAAACYKDSHKRDDTNYIQVFKAFQCSRGTADSRRLHHTLFALGLLLIGLQSLTIKIGVYWWTFGVPVFQLVKSHQN